MEHPRAACLPSPRKVGKAPGMLDGASSLLVSRSPSAVPATTHEMEGLDVFGTTTLGCGEMGKSKGEDLRFIHFHLF